jgi:alkylation response protein AidB-like acyl-CoA dehydrogenase
MTVYRAPVEDYMFVLHELLRVQDLSPLKAFENVGADMTRQILEGVATFCEEVYHPLNAVGDEQGCVVENGVVRTPDGFADAYRQYREAGWNRLGAAEEHGGAGMPGVVVLPASEFAVAANAGLALYSGLTNAAHAALARTGAEWMLEHVVPRMVDGEWSGTMCLTEPHCGTDLRLMKTRAVARPDGTYRITGTKIFISGGDHDLTDNIIHLVLAKLPNPAGRFVDDLSTVNFFMVPKFNIDPSSGRMVDRNSVSIGGIEKKMGIRGNPACVLNFDEAIGYRLAGRAPAPGRQSSSAGMAGMFAMMNRARLGTGIAALAVAEKASQNADAYARGRVAGKSRPGSGALHTIGDYPDVKRLLMRQRAFIEGARALGAWVSLQIDLEQASDDAAQRQRSGNLATLLTPVIKACFSDGAFQAANDTVQVYGGHGYIRDNGVEQFVRDTRIYQIYEGANGVQAFDLVARKIPAQGGGLVATFLDEINTTIAEVAFIPALDACTAALRDGRDDLVLAAKWAVANGGDEHSAAAGGSYDVMNIFGAVAIGLMWLRAAKVAWDRLESGAGDRRFYERKLALARFWAKRELPLTRVMLERARLGNDGLVDLAATRF